MARRFRVADTSRTTRSADQPSGCILDRPAVNGRAHSPSRLKPADPNGACTQPIDSGACAPPSLLQGACGFSPGLKPWAFDADRLHGDRQWHRGSHLRGIAAPPGRRVRHRLPPVRTGRSTESWPAGTLPGRSAHLVGARQHLARGATGRGIAVGTHHARRIGGQHRRPIIVRPAAFPGPHARAPTAWGENGRAQSSSRLKPADRDGAPQAADWLHPLRPSQPPSGGLRIQPGASAPGVRCRPPARRSAMAPQQPSAWDCRPSGPAGQAPPDPYRTGDTAPPLEVSVAPATCWPIGVGARRCLARGASGAADCRGVHRPCPRPHRYRDHRSTTAFLALTGGRVGHPLIPTNGGSGAVPWRTRAPLGMRRPTM
jgi:hypothetical protein